MNPPSSPQCPSSFDPAIHLHSEGPGDAFPPPNYSDDIHAHDTLLAECAARKNTAGVVIQHRAWRTFEEAFRSEEDHIVGKTFHDVSVARNTR
jgi:chromosome transmission fidelity protein 18